MWFPTIAELITAGVVTRVVNPSDLAISGIDQSEFATERLQKTLLNIKIYAAIYHADPDAYAKILESFQTGLRKGVTMTDLGLRSPRWLVRYFTGLIRTPQTVI